MTVTTMVLAAILLIVPVTLAVTLWRKRFDTKVEWLIAALTCVSFAGYVLLAGRWDIYSYYLRPLLALAVVAAFVMSLLRVRSAPRWKAPTSLGQWLNLGASVFVAGLFAAMAGVAASGLWARGEQHVNLSFPLPNGVSYVAHGGASTLLNYHHGHRAQAYALDVTGLNPAGLRAWGIAPSDNSRYAVFGRDVHSPCRGTVIESRSDLPDLTPPTADRENPAGNHVVIRCDDTSPAVDVDIAHLKQGSLVVATGSRVATGQLLGKVGNTGNTSEPHLHVHAVRTGSGNTLEGEGEGVPIRFDDRFLTRNSLSFGN